MQKDDVIYRQAAIDLFPNDALEWDTKDGYVAPHLARRMIEELPSAQQQYEPVTAEDFAKRMSETTIYNFLAWHGEALMLMESMGFIICKKEGRCGKPMIKGAKVYVVTTAVGIEGETLNGVYATKEAALEWCRTSYPHMEAEGYVEAPGGLRRLRYITSDVIPLFIYIYEVEVM